MHPSEHGKPWPKWETKYYYSGGSEQIAAVCLWCEHQVYANTDSVLAQRMTDHDRNHHPAADKEAISR